jgi:menaquinone-dependent protoporphyrinogen oxidase
MSRSNPRVLVTAASRHESTREIAEAIAAGLRERGVDGQVLPVAEVSTLAGYDAVVLGSAVYMGRWLAEARRFAQVQTSRLCSMPTWLFSSGPLGPADRLFPAGEPADVPVLLRLTRARGHRTFAGRLEMERLHFTERAMARAVHAPEGDSRDWETIDGFAGEIAEALLSARIAA